MKKIILMCLFGLMVSQAKLETRMYEFTAFHDEIININEITGKDLQIYFLEIMDIELSNIQYGGTNPNIVMQANVSNSSPFDEQRVLIKMSDKIEPYYNSNDYYPSKQVFTTHELKIENSNGPTHDPMLFKIVVTAEFPEEDTGYIEEGFDFCLVSGNNLVAFPCDNPVSVETAIPELAQAEIEQIIGAGQAATNLNGQFIGSLSNFTPGAGYWFKSSSNMCFNYACAE